MVATQIRPWGFPEGDIWSAEIRILISVASFLLQAGRDLFQPEG